MHGVFALGCLTMSFCFFKLYNCYLNYSRIEVSTIKKGSGSSSGGKMDRSMGETMMTSENTAPSKAANSLPSESHHLILTQNPELCVSFFISKGPYI